MASADNTNQARTQTRKALPAALNPEAPALVQPYKEFVARGWITSWKCGGNSLMLTWECDVSEDLGGKTHISAIEAKRLIEEKGLWSPKGGKNQSQKKEQPKPAKSIVVDDFNGNDTQLLARARSVANALGPETARGRIGSHKLYKQGIDAFPKWWENASGDEKCRILTDRKHYDKLSSVHKSRLGGLFTDCPFRGTVPTPATEEEDEPPKRPGRQPTPSQATGSKRPSPSKK